MVIIVISARCYEIFHMDNSNLHLGFYTLPLLAVYGLSQKQLRALLNACIMSLLLFPDVFIKVEIGLTLLPTM